MGSVCDDGSRGWMIPKLGYPDINGRCHKFRVYISEKGRQGRIKPGESAKLAIDEKLEEWG